MRKTFSTVVSFLLLTACQGLPTFPAKSVFETDTDNNLCVEYEIIDPQRLQLREKKRHQLSRCNGVFGFDPDDVGRVNTWIRNAIQTCQNCRQKNLELQAKMKGTDGDSTIEPCSDQDSRDATKAAIGP